jgi:hypothetical protein
MTRRWKEIVHVLSIFLCLFGVDDADRDRLPNAAYDLASGVCAERGGGVAGAVPGSGAVPDPGSAAAADSDSLADVSCCFRSAFAWNREVAAMLQNLRWLALVVIVAATPAFAGAEQVRYHFVPSDPCGTLTQVPAGPDRTIGELKRAFGAVPLPYPFAVTPNHMVTFRHPFTGRNVTVPLRLPDGPPRMEQRADRIVYTHGDYIVEVRFFAGGSVDVVYNSGFLRPLRFE